MHSHAVDHSTADDDVSLAGRVAGHDHAAFETVMRRYNSRLFRVARAILRDDADAEDALQDAYLDAYRHMDRFRGDSALLTWLTRIVINHSLMRVRKRKQQPVVVPFVGPGAQGVRDQEVDVPDTTSESASTAVLRAELRRRLERLIDDLPDTFRTVFVMRDIEDMSVEETAVSLSIPSATVRTRLFRARALMREALERDVDGAISGVFSFDGHRCDRIVLGVLTQLPGIDSAAPAS